MRLIRALISHCNQRTNYQFGEERAKDRQKRQIRQREEERENWELAFLRITRLFSNHRARTDHLRGGSRESPERNHSSAAAWCYLVGVDLAFLAEAWRHILGLDLLLGHVVLVLVEKMLVLHLKHGQR